MTTTYLVPCSCGEKFQVDASESGLVMKCRCGASLEVPALRGLAQLEQVIVGEPPRPQRAWGGAQRGMAVGALIAILGLGLGIYWTVKPLPRPQDVFEDQELMALKMFRNEENFFATPAGVVVLWGMIEQQGLSSGEPKFVEKYRSQRRVHQWWRMVGYIVGGVGAAIFGVSLIVYWSRRGRSERPRLLVATGG